MFLIFNFCADGRGGGEGGRFVSVCQIEGGGRSAPGGVGLALCQKVHHDLQPASCLERQLVGLITLHHCMQRLQYCHSAAAFLVRLKVGARRVLHQASTVNAHWQSAKDCDACHKDHDRL